MRENISFTMRYHALGAFLKIKYKKIKTFQA
jgi:hypothetical protein